METDVDVFGVGMILVIFREFNSRLVVAEEDVGARLILKICVISEHSQSASFAVKRFYKGCCVHGVQPRGMMVGSGEGAGRMHVTTGVVGHCRNTGGQIGTGKTKQNKGRGTYCSLSKYTGSSLYTAAHEATMWYIQKRNAAVCDHGKTRNGAEHDRQTLSELRDRCQNVSATSLLALNLHPNVARIGTLQRHELWQYIPIWW